MISTLSKQSKESICIIFPSWHCLFRNCSDNRVKDHLVDTQEGVGGVGGGGDSSSRVNKIDSDEHTNIELDFQELQIIKRYDPNMIPIKPINPSLQTKTQIIFPFFLFANCKCHIAAWTITNTQLQHSNINNSKYTTAGLHITQSLHSKVSSHHYHLSHFQIPKSLLSLLPITYYLLYCYLFPSFLFPVSCSRIPNSLTLTLFEHISSTSIIYFIYRRE